MEVVIEDYRQRVLQNQTITSSGSSGTFTDFGAKEINLVINVTGPVTGSSPTIQFTLQEVDPGDGTTSFGTPKTSAIITSTGVYTVTLPVMIGGDVVVSWTVGGIAPSFGGVYATVLNKVAGTSVLYDASGAPVFGTAGSPGSAVLTVQGVSGGQPSPVSGTVTATQGTAAALSGAWPTQVTDGTNTLPTMDAVGRAGFQKITDGTNGPVAIKPASTAAVATDPALVVAISPNNPIVATNPSVGVNTSTAPTSSTQVGGSDGTNLQAARVFDVDSGGGTQYVLGVGLRKAASGGSVEAGTSSDPLRTDPTGTTTQPVSGTVTGNQGTPNSIGNSWPVEITDGTDVLGTAAHPIRTDPTGTTTQPVSGTVTANVGTTGGLALDATLTGGTAKTIVRGGAKGATVAADVTSTAEGADHQGLDVQIYHGGTAKDPTQIRALTSADVVTSAQGTAAALSGAWPVKVTDGTNTMPTGDVVGRAIFHKITDGTNTAAVKAASTAAVATDPALVVAVSPNNTIPVSSTQLPAALVGGRLDENVGAWLGSTAPTVGQKTMANSVPVVLASDHSHLLRGTVSTANSSTTPLGVSGTFTGTFEEVTDFSMVTVSIFADQNSASNGLVFQWSSDGTNIDRTESSNLDLNVGRAFSLTIRARYFRVVYTNGTSGQSVFRLGTVYHPTGTGLVTRPVSGTLTGDNFALLTKSVITGIRPDGVYDDVKLDSSARLIVTTPSEGASDSGFSDGRIVLASTTITAVRATTYTEQTSNAQRSIVSASANDTSAGTGARTVRINYYALSAGVVTGPFSEDITLNGTTPVNTVASDICYIENMVVLTVGSTGSNVGVLSLKAATGGGGATIWSIAATDNKTFGSHHYVPNGKTAHITGFVGGIKGADTTSFFLRVADPTNANSAEVQVSDLLRVPSSGQSNRTYASPIMVDGPARIIAYTAPDSSSSRTYYASFDFYEGDTP